MSKYAPWYQIAWRCLWAVPAYVFWAALWLVTLVGWGKADADRVRKL